VVVVVVMMMKEAIETLARVIANLPENKHAHARLQIYQIPAPFAFAQVGVVSRPVVAVQ
jgi:hypothetical protein